MASKMWAENWIENLIHSYPITSFYVIIGYKGCLIYPVSKYYSSVKKNSILIISLFIKEGVNREYNFIEAFKCILILSSRIGPDSS